VAASRRGAAGLADTGRDLTSEKPFKTGLWTLQYYKEGCRNIETFEIIINT